MKKVILMTLLTAVTASGFFGCAKKNSDPDVTPVNNVGIQPVYDYQNGQNVCISNCYDVNNPNNPMMNVASLTGLIVQGTSLSQNGITLTAAILGDQNMITQMQAQGAKPFISYSGSVGLNGVLQIAQTIYLKGYIQDPYSTCQIPAGQYQLSLTQPGYTQNGPGAINYTYNSVVAQGPASITLTNMRFVLSDVNGDGYPDKMNPAFRMSVGNGACEQLPVLLF